MIGKYDIDDIITEFCLKTIFDKIHANKQPMPYRLTAISFDFFPFMVFSIHFYLAFKLTATKKKYSAKPRNTCGRLENVRCAKILYHILLVKNIIF